MKIAVKLPKIAIIPRTVHELDFFQEMLSKMKASFVVSKTDESFLYRYEERLKEAKMMKEGKLPKNL